MDDFVALGICFMACMLLLHPAGGPTPCTEITEGTTLLLARMFDFYFPKALKIVGKLEMSSFSTMAKPTGYYVKLLWLGNLSEDLRYCQDVRVILDLPFAGNPPPAFV